MVQSKQFPTLSERLTVAAVLKYAKLASGSSVEQQEVLGLHSVIRKQFKDERDIIYLSNPIPSRVAEFYGDFVAGDSEDILIDGSALDAEGQKLLAQIVYESDLKELFSRLAESQSVAGKAVSYVYTDAAGTPVIGEVPADQYFPQSDGSVVLATYVSAYDQSVRKLKCLTQHFRIDGGRLVIERQAWNCNDDGVVAEEVPLESVAALLGLSVDAVSSYDGITEIPIRASLNGRDGSPDIKACVPQLAEINERMSHVSVELLKNLDAKMVLPSSLADESGNVRAFDTIFIPQGQTDVNARYVTNSNPLIADAREHVTEQVKLVSLATGVPMWEITKGAMPDNAKALRIQMFPAIRKASRKRASLRRSIQDLIRIAFMFKGKKLEQDIPIKFGDVLPVDELEQAQVEDTRIRAGISSRRNAIQRTYGMDEAQAQDEFDAIREEETLVGAGTMDAPQLGV